MYYAIYHKTSFRYSAPIRESMMEVRMQPLSEDSQRCQRFALAVEPHARILAYTDHLGNNVHHFDIPRAHTRLTITAEALVEVNAPPALPERLDGEPWEALATLAAENESWDWLAPSHFAQPTALLQELARELRVRPADRQRADPLSLLCELNTALYNTFSYEPQSTSVDSPIDHALESRQGVCQDYAHVMIALVRQLGIPCRYVSGYLFHRSDSDDRSAHDATHAWVEARLPELGWIGFDPTNNLIVGGRHIRTAVGRDYADVPPTRGVFKGAATSELEVAVRVTPVEPPALAAPPLPATGWAPQEYGAQAQMQQMQQ